MHFLNHVAFAVLHLAEVTQRRSGYIAIELGDQQIPTREEFLQLFLTNIT